MSEKSQDILNIAIKNLKSNSNFLDLGCGNGKDSIFMSKNGFNVVAIDISKNQINDLNNFIKENNIPNIKTKNCNMLEFDIEDNKFDFILLNNSIQFIERKQALDFINKIKDKVKDNGLIMISAFTDKDTTIKQEKQKNIRFKENELKEIFADFNILYFFEGIIDDKPHFGAYFPHKHGIVKILAQKNK